MYNNQMCTCDTSDTEGSDPGYGDSCCASSNNDCVCNGGGGNVNGNDPNFAMNYDGQQAQSWAQQSSGFTGQASFQQKQPSFSQNMAQPPMRQSQVQQANAAPQEPRASRMSQSRASGEYKAAGPLPGCTCPSARRASGSQSQPQPPRLSATPIPQSQQSQRISFAPRGSSKASSLSQIRTPSVSGPPSPAEFRASQMVQGNNGDLPPDYPTPPEDLAVAQSQQMGFAQPYETRKQSQTNALGQPRMSATNQRAPSLSQQNAQGCNAAVCQGGPGTQTPRRSSQMSTGMAQNVVEMSQGPPPPPQVINPCCTPNSAKQVNSAPPPPPPAELQQNGSNGCSCSQPPPPPPANANEGGLCYCPTNIAPEEPPVEQSNASDVCPSCAEFESEPEPENSEPEPCPPDQTCENPDDNEAPPEEVEQPPPANLETAPSKKSGFAQQLQFQVCQSTGGGSSQQSSEGNGQPENNPNNGNAMASNPDGNGNKSNGKHWQQLTLDIYQTQGGGSEGSDLLQGGWQQQLRLMIYQETSNDSNDATANTTVTNESNEMPPENEGENQDVPPPEEVPPPPSSDCEC